jgi:hypothetical protein
MEPVPTTLPEVQFLPVIISAVVMMLVGSLWYSSFLFGKAWVRHTGIRATDIRPSETRRGYIVSVFTCLLSAYLLGIIAAHVGQSRTLFCGVALIWLFVMVEQLNGFLWRRDPLALFLLQAFRSLFALLAGALVFYFWS